MMLTEWMPLLLLILTLFALVFLKRWLDQHIQGLSLLLFGSEDLAMWLYFFVLFPGVVLHEASHWLAARLLGAKPGPIKVWPSKRRGKQLRLGYVRIQETDPLRGSIIGLAPLLSGSLVVLFLASRVFGITLPAGATTSDQLLVQVVTNLGTYATVPDAWFWLYMTFVVSNGMMPSQSDRRPLGPLLIFIGLVGLAFYLSGWWPEISPETVATVLQGMDYLAFAFGLTVIVDVIFVAAIFVVEKTVGGVTGRQVEY